MLKISSIWLKDNKSFISWEKNLGSKEFFRQKERNFDRFHLKVNVHLLKLNKQSGIFAICSLYGRIALYKTNESQGFTCLNLSVSQYACSCDCVCVCVCGLAVSFGLVVSIIRSLSLSSVSLLFLSAPLCLLFTSPVPSCHPNTFYVFTSLLSLFPSFSPPPPPTSLPVTDEF